MDAERGKYFRIVATVQADGVDVVPLMIERGMGRAYRVGRRAGWCEEGSGTAALGGDARKRLLCVGNAPQQREGLLFLIAQCGEGFLKGLVRRLPHEFAQLLPEFLREASQ